MKYFKLVEGSEVNCDVYLDDTGLLDVTPIDARYDFKFSYRTYDMEGNFIEEVEWDNDTYDADLIEMSEVRAILPPEEIIKDFFGAIPQRKKEFRPDSNHKSSL